MPPPEPTWLSSISVHAWNKDQSQLALSPNSNQVFIYASPGDDFGKWKQTHTLDDHFMTVTGIDWNGATNAIVTSGQDRNAYVWQLKNNEWKPTLVVLRIGRAATCVKWSPDGKKFAVGSSSKQIPVCHYEKSQDMWVAKMIKKGPKSSILAVDWSPNNLFVIAGGSDFKCRIYSGYVPEVDGDCNVGEEYKDFANEAANFGAILAEFDQSRGWIEACKFSPSGSRFAFAGHDSTVHFGEIGGDVQTILRRDLPLRTICFLTDTLAVGGGYDNVPIIYEFKNGNWEEKGPLDTGKAGKDKGGKKSAFGAAKGMWEAKGKLGKDQAQDASLPFRHQNIINDVIRLSDTQFSTSGIDGRVLKWDVKKSY